MAEVENHASKSAATEGDLKRNDESKTAFVCMCLVVLFLAVIVVAIPESNTSEELHVSGNSCNSTDTSVLQFHNATVVTRFLYFTVVTFTSVGYGDFHPLQNEKTFKFIVALLVLSASIALPFFTGTLLAMLNRCEERFVDVYSGTIMVDPETRKVRPLYKVALCSLVVLSVILIGMTLAIQYEGFNHLDAFYFATVSVTTVGYGDLSFSSMPGQLFGSLWIGIATVLFNMAFGYIAELSIGRNKDDSLRTLLNREFTGREFAAVDVQKKGSISEVDYFVYKVKELYGAKAADLAQLRENFRRLNPNNNGLVEITEA